MADEQSVTLALRAGHTLTADTDWDYAAGPIPPAMVREVWRYSCSCGEIAAVPTDVAQAHVAEVAP